MKLRQDWSAIDSGKPVICSAAGGRLSHSRAARSRVGHLLTPVGPELAYMLSTLRCDSCLNAALEGFQGRGQVGIVLAQGLNAAG